MTEEERKRYFGVLVENLYSQLQVVSESNRSDKGELATEIIWNFYNKYKEDYKLNHIEDVTRELDRVDRDIKKSHVEREQEEK